MHSISLKTTIAIEEPNQNLGTTLAFEAFCAPTAPRGLQVQQGASQQSQRLCLLWQLILHQSVLDQASQGSSQASHALLEVQGWVCFKKLQGSEQEYVQGIWIGKCLCMRVLLCTAGWKLQVQLGILLSLLPFGPARGHTSCSSLILRWRFPCCCMLLYPFVNNNFASMFALQIKSTY